MRFIAILNREGGTLRTTDLDALSAGISETLTSAGHEVDVEIVASSEIEAALDRATRATGVDTVLIGGGDGSVSAAAAKLMNGRKALAILPAGTMNLFARSLQIPLDLDAAVKAFATGRIRAVDIATANGRPFVHQFSIGVHAKLVRLREKMEFASRWGKMRASLRAALDTVMAPPSMNVTLVMGGTEIFVRTTGVGVTNNLFGEGHLPYADRPDGGTLGIYVTTARSPRELALFLLNVARGKWRRNDKVVIHESDEVTIRVSNRRRRRRCVIDGELCQLDPETIVRIHPGALRVLVPAEDEGAAA